MRREERPFPRSPAAAAGMATAVLVAGLLVAHHPVLLSRLARVQGDMGDARLVNWILEHTYRWVGRWEHHQSFWNAPFFFPVHNTTAYAEVLLGVAWLYWPWRLLGAAPDTAFQLWTLSASVVNFGAMWLLLRRALHFGTVPAAVGAFLFAFGSPRLNQLGHPQLVPQFWSVMAVHAVFRLFDDRPPREHRWWLVVLAIALAAQLWAAFYLGWFMLIGLATAALWSLVLPATRGAVLRLLTREGVSIVVAGALMGALLAPMVAHYLAAAHEIGHRSYDEVLEMVPRLHSWVDMGPNNWAWGWSSGTGLFAGIPYEHEHRLGIGPLTLGLIVAGFASHPRGAAVRILGLSAITLMAASTLLPVGEWTAWRLIYWIVPGASAIRAVARIALVLLIPAAIGLARFVETVGPRRLGSLVTLTLSLLSMLEQGQTTPAFDKQASRAEIQAIAARIDGSCNAFYWSPVDTRLPAWAVHVDAMWAQMATEIPTINGYSGGWPRGWDDFWEAHLVTPEDRARLERALQEWSRRRGLPRKQVCWVSGPSAP